MDTSWLLCTRTKNKDYFWLGRNARPTELYTRVADETNYRCGYFVADGGGVEVGLNRLDARRHDNGNRRIRHSLILSAAADGKEAEFLRKLFAQAVTDATPTATDSAAAVLARRLFAWWEKADASTRAAAAPDWRDFARELDNAIPDIPKVEPLATGCYYRRTPENLARLAASAEFRAHILLLCVATNSGAGMVRELKKTTTILCTLEEGRNSEPLPIFMARLRTPAQAVRKNNMQQVSAFMERLRTLTQAVRKNNMQQGYQQLKRRYPGLPKLFLILAVAIALAVVWSLATRKAEHRDEKVTAQANTPQSQAETDGAKESTEQTGAGLPRAAHANRNQTQAESPIAASQADPAPEDPAQRITSP